MGAEKESLHYSFTDPSLILHFVQDKVQDKVQNDKFPKDNLLNERLSSNKKSLFPEEDPRISEKRMKNRTDIACPLASAFVKN